MFENLLPIGSVVMLQGGVKKLMIIGYKVAKKDMPEKYYDYIGVLYPEGYVDVKYHFLFNHEDINDVVFLGYDNPERKGFIQFLEEAAEKEKMIKER